jgi:hypothetical protein
VGEILGVGPGLNFPVRGSFRELPGAFKWLVLLLGLFAGIALFNSLFFARFDGGPMPRQNAKNDASLIARALESYLAEYGKFPAEGVGNVNSAELMNRLAGTIPNDPINFREVVFIEVPKARKHGNGAEMEGEMFTSGYKDSWGNDYEIRIDNEGGAKSYDGKVEGPAGVVKKSVIVWSRGDPKKRDKYDDPAKWIKSWE